MWKHKELFQNIYANIFWKYSEKNNYYKKLAIIRKIKYKKEYNRQSLENIAKNHFFVEVNKIIYLENIY